MPPRRPAALDLGGGLRRQTVLLAHRSFECGISDGDATRGPNYVNGLDLPIDSSCTIVSAVRRGSVRLDVNGRTVMEYRSGAETVKSSSLYVALRPDSRSSPSKAAWGWKSRR